jgi:BirA family biotin operon repressor/biotin-[acetyl-CoA-carboxylase] ligase
MDQLSLEQTLQDLPLGAIRYLPQVTSTNDMAAEWTTQGARNLSLVVADEQTAGRGRAGRQWITPPGGALAASLIVYPTLADQNLLPRMTALGALAVCDALRNSYQLPAQIKWPNDILVNRRKLAGILTEAHWTGDSLAAVILGMGVNVASTSVSESVLPAARLRFPATSVEDELHRPTDRLALLHAILVEFLRWRQRMGHADFISAWEKRLAFRGERVQVFQGGSGEQSHTGTLPLLVEGEVAGLTQDGALKVTTRSGDVVTVQFGEVRLRPLDAVAGSVE